MKPITFDCKETLTLTTEDVARQILDVTNWPDFYGYGPIPGIKTAEYEVRMPSIIGSRIRVTNLDGSTHIEEIVEWEPNHRLRLHMHEFRRRSPALRLDLMRRGSSSEWATKPQSHVLSRLTPSQLCRGRSFG